MESELVWWIYGNGCVSFEIWVTMHFDDECSWVLGIFSFFWCLILESGFPCEIRVSENVTAAAND